MELVFGTLFNFNYSIPTIQKSHDKKIQFELKNFELNKTV